MDYLIKLTDSLRDYYDFSEIKRNVDSDGSDIATLTIRDIKEQIYIRIHDGHIQAKTNLSESGNYLIDSSIENMSPSGAAYLIQKSYGEVTYE